jgi:Glycosyl transferase family 2
MDQPPEAGRQFEFNPTEAVRRTRARAQFARCPACGADVERYLFHERGVRFVQCQICRLVYVNPPTRGWPPYLEASHAARHLSPRDREHFQGELRGIVADAAKTFQRRRGVPPRRALVAGRSICGEPLGAGVPTEVVSFTHDELARFVDDADIAPVVAALRDDTDVVVLNQLLEACPRVFDVVEKLAASVGSRALVVVVFSNVASLPGRVLRRYWPRSFEGKSVYYDPENLRHVMDRGGFTFVEQRGLRTRYTLSRAAKRLGGETARRAKVLHALRLGDVTIRVPTGTYTAIFERSELARRDELLSIIVPVFNEVRYIAPVLDGLLALQLAIPKEIVVVESNSTDGTRDRVRSYAGRDGLRVVYEDKPQGKGAAVRRGLAEVDGSIVIIQDADFEYDLDDYEALLEPILQRRTSFVLGSRSLGLEDWKVRRFASSRGKAFLMNVAQLAFAKTFNVLYQQQVSDVNTMFKVFRRECLDGLDLRAGGFSFDIELACMIVKNGFGPMEVPVNYVARSFEEGKKIRFASEFFPSYSMFFRCRFGRSRGR